MAEVNSNVQAQNIINHTLELVKNPGGVKLDFQARALRLFSYTGSIIFKGNKSYMWNNKYAMWNNSSQVWALDKEDNEVKLLNPKDQKSNDLADKFNLVRQCKCILESEGRCWKLTLTPTKELDVPIKQGIVYINKQNYQPVQLKVKWHIFWITVDITNFTTGTFSDNLFNFPKSKYPNVKVIDKRS